MRKYLYCLAAIANAQASKKQDGSRAPVYDGELAKRLGADERGMKLYVFCILKTGPKDAEIKGKEREDIFAGHFANIDNLAQVAASK